MEDLKKPYEKPVIVQSISESTVDKADPADVVPIVAGVAIIAAAVWTKYC